MAPEERGREAERGVELVRSLEALDDVTKKEYWVRPDPAAPDLDVVAYEFAARYPAQPAEAERVFREEAAKEFAVAHPAATRKVENAWSESAGLWVVPERDGAPARAEPTLENLTKAQTEIDERAALVAELARKREELSALEARLGIKGKADAKLPDEAPDGSLAAVPEGTGLCSLCRDPRPALPGKGYCAECAQLLQVVNRWPKNVEFK
jgi:hypothetical protein